MSWASRVPCLARDTAMKGLPIRGAGFAPMPVAPDECASTGAAEHCFPLRNLSTPVTAVATPFHHRCNCNLEAISAAPSEAPLRVGHGSCRAISPSLQLRQWKRSPLPPQKVGFRILGACVRKVAPARQVRVLTASSAAAFSAATQRKKGYIQGIFFGPRNFLGPLGL